MTVVEKEVTPILNAPHELQSTSTFTEARLVRFPPDDPTIEQQMHLMENSGVLDFWNRPEENGYTCTDGDPI